jgi:hypothetical protein
MKHNVGISYRNKIWACKIVTIYQTTRKIHVSLFRPLIEVVLRLNKTGSQNLLYVHDTEFQIVQALLIFCPFTCRGMEMTIRFFETHQKMLSLIPASKGASTLLVFVLARLVLVRRLVWLLLVLVNLRPHYFS